MLEDGANNSQRNPEPWLGEGRSQGSFPSWPWLQPPPPALCSKGIPSREGAQWLNPCSTPPSLSRPTAHLAQWHHHLCLTPNIYSFPGKQAHETRRKNRRNPSFPFCVGGRYFLAAPPSQKWLPWIRPSLSPDQRPFKSSLKPHPCSKFARDCWSQGSTASSLTICHACVEEKQPPGPQSCRQPTARETNTTQPPYSKTMTESWGRTQEQSAVPRSLQGLQDKYQEEGDSLMLLV